jgi:hypothetical protein
MSEGAKTYIRVKIGEFEVEYANNSAGNVDEFYDNQLKDLVDMAKEELGEQHVSIANIISRE